MSKTFQEQLKFLKNRWEVVPLSKLPIEENTHLEMLQDFKVKPIIREDGKKETNPLQYFIRGYLDIETIPMKYRGGILEVERVVFRWDAKYVNDTDHNRIFLVIDNEAMDENGLPDPQVVFYFGLSCGLIMDTPEKIDVEAEKTVIDGFLQCKQISDKDQRKKLEIDYYDAVKRVLGAKRARKLLEIAEGYFTKQMDQKVTGETDQEVYLADETFPAIELSHFVKNENYHLPEEVDDFTVGEYVFWEIIMEKINTISVEAGLQYVYLFAADSKKNGDLISYYGNNYGFLDVKDMRLIKPSYDYYCHSMVADISELRNKRTMVWQSLDTDGKRKRKKKDR